MIENFIKDRFSAARGSYSRLLIILCGGCRARLCAYQKDGPGELKRMYIDRIFDAKFNRSGKGMTCFKCNQVLGVKFTYEKENRSAYRLFVGSVEKKITKLPKR